MIVSCGAFFSYFYDMPDRMKKYSTIGELLIDYRKINQLSQADFAARLNVDIRTVQRWENGSTLIKPDKEEGIVNETLLPYQLLRNLNASVPIPTFYDFSLRKYSLSELTNSLPNAHWFKSHLEIATKRIRTLDYEVDIDYIVRYMKYHKKITKSLKEVIKEAVRLLPEMNLIITDDSGYYSGHSLIFPLKPEAYEKLRSRQMNEQELTVNDLTHHRKLDQPIFFGFDITADSNDNNFYLTSQLFRFVRDKPNQKYLFCSIPIRYDNVEVSDQIGLKIVWEGERGKNEHGLEVFPRFQEGNFKNFLSEDN
jgi:transcriptional regulator with XRE-family HTH domain